MVTGDLYGPGMFRSVIGSTEVTGTGSVPGWLGWISTDSDWTLSEMRTLRVSLDSTQALLSPWTLVKSLS